MEKSNILIISVISILIIFGVALFAIIKNDTNPIKVTCYGTGSGSGDSGNSCQIFEDHGFELEVSNDSIATKVNVFVESYNEAEDRWEIRNAFYDKTTSTFISVLELDSTKNVALFSGHERIVVMVDEKDALPQFPVKGIALNLGHFPVTGHTIYEVDSGLHKLTVQILGIVSSKGGHGEEYHIPGHICRPDDRTCGTD